MKKVLLAVTSLLIVSQVQAGPITPCTKANLNGSYVMYQAAVNNPDRNHTGRCEITINNGLLSGSCAFDPAVDGQPNFNGPVYGDATMNTNCSANLTVEFDPVPEVVHIKSNFELQFTPNKEGFMGKFSNNFGIYGITNGTRVSPALSSAAAK